MLAYSLVLWSIFSTTASSSQMTQAWVTLTHNEPTQNIRSAMLATVVVMTTSTFSQMLSVPGTPKRVPILHGKKPRFPEANSWRSQDLGNSSDYPCSMLLFAWSTHSTESSANPRGRLHCQLQLTQSKVRHRVWLTQGHTRWEPVLPKPAGQSCLSIWGLGFSL